VPLSCPSCSSTLDFAGGSLSCPGGHAVPIAAAGIADLLDPGQPLPNVDAYSTPIGWAYDHGVNNRVLAQLAGRLEWGADIRRLYRLMDEGVRARLGEIVLDVPVGGGTTFAEGAPHLEGILIGVDLSTAMLSRAARRRSRHGLEDRVILARGDATALPVPDSSVDRVLCFNGLHVLPAKEKALAEFRRVLRPGGELLGTVLVEDGSNPFAALVALERLARFFVPANSGLLPSMAAAAGFTTWEQEVEGTYLYFRGQLGPTEPGGDRTDARSLVRPRRVQRSTAGPDDLPEPAPDRPAPRRP